MAGVDSATMAIPDQIPQRVAAHLQGGPCGEFAMAVDETTRLSCLLGQKGRIFVREVLESAFPGKRHPQKEISFLPNAAEKHRRPWLTHHADVEPLAADGDDDSMAITPLNQVRFVATGSNMGLGAQTQKFRRTSLGH